MFYSSSSKLRQVLLYLLFCTTLQWNSASASLISYTMIADTATPVPGGSAGEKFAAFYPPSYSKNNTAFWATSTIPPSHSFVSMGIYKYIDNKLDVVADTNTQIPKGTGTFENFGREVSIKDRNIAFRGSSPSTSQNGIYREHQGTILAFANEDTTAPGDFRKFDNLRGPSTTEFNSLSFWGRLPEGAKILPGGGLEYFPLKEGIYSATSNIIVSLVDTDDPIPDGTGNFTAFGPESVVVDNSFTAFIGHGESNQEGLYMNAHGSTWRVVDNSTPIPHGNGTFSSLFAPSINANQLAFVGLGDKQAGIYRAWNSIHGPVVERIADLNTLIPGQANAFVDFGAYVSLDFSTLDIGKAAFVGFDPSMHSGIYIYDRSTLEKIISEGDLLFGKAIDGLAISPDALDGNSIAFSASFSDGSQGIFVANVPEPSTIILFISGIIGLFEKRGQRKQ
ncbi:hypothetical protein DJ030_07305 [bacterium endosymbiont of Escarpia laminata]|nr:MAG: hypothetical protein DJ030_07305 [bacterium endosymbiont of Escarpia laminata]